MNTVCTGRLPGCPPARLSGGHRPLPGRAAGPVRYLVLLQSRHALRQAGAAGGPAPVRAVGDDAPAQEPSRDPRRAGVRPADRRRPAAHRGPRGRAGGYRRVQALLARARTTWFDRRLSRIVARRRPSAVAGLQRRRLGTTLPLCRRLGIPAILSMVHGDVREELEVLEREASLSPSSSRSTWATARSTATSSTGSTGGGSATSSWRT